MEITKQLFIALAAFITSTSLSCQKEKDDLPKATEDGKNTFGCKIDGKLFIPEKTITYPAMPPLRSFYGESDGYFELRVSEDTDEANNGLQRYMIFKLYNLEIGGNTLNEENKVLVIISEGDQSDNRYETNTTIGGTLNITRLDTVANIISGTFTFNAGLISDNSKILSVTEGRFDVTYKS